MDIFKKIGKTVADTVTSLRQDDEVKTWLNEIADARKREQSYIREGERCVSIYEQGGHVDGAVTPDYNVLYSNTETIRPAVYSNLPRPLVKRRFSDPNDVATAGARVIQNTLSYLIKVDEDGYSTFNDIIKSAVNEALVPGRGMSRCGYDADIVRGEEGQPQQLKSEYVCSDEVPWNRLLMGYGKTWSKVPWIAFESFLTREECIKTFGKQLGGEIPLNSAPKEDGDTKDRAPADAAGAKFAHIYEIWDKRDKKVKFLSEGWPTLIKTDDDPLNLRKFFPMPRPITFKPTISSMIPQTLFQMYEKQARELNDVTYRIGMITKAMKVRGVYDSTISDLSRVMEAKDNQLIAATNVAALQDNQGLAKAIWLMPIEVLVSVLQQLYINRENIKKVIYEITGIADIMRGSSQASETLGAQKMKAQFGSMRLSDYQDEVARYVVDLLNIMADIACSKFGVETFKQITGILLPMNTEKEQAMQIIQQAQIAAQQAQFQAQQQSSAGPSGASSAQSQSPADPMQSPEVAQAQKIMASPSWEEVIAFISNDMHRQYAIQIETNSTLAEEMSEDREDLVQFMQGMGGFVQSIMTQVKEQILPFDTAKAMILAICQKFRIGIEVEEQLKQMQAPQVPQQGQDPKMAAEAARINQQMTFEKEKHEQQMSNDAAKLQNEREKMQEELQLLRDTNAMKREAMQLDLQISKEKADAERMKAGIKLQTEQAVGAAKVEQVNQAGAVQGALQGAQIDAAHQQSAHQETMNAHKETQAAKPPVKKD